jgi:CDGSH-type Zn-finger protein
VVTVRVRRNGPYVIEGDDVRVVDSGGAALHPSKLPVALCRCGASETKPFCYRSHARIGFCPDGEADVSPAPEAQLKR